MALQEITIKMPPIRETAPEDIEAVLFEYVATAPKGSGILTVSDLDDAWVHENFEGFSGIEELKGNIKDQMDKEAQYDWAQLRYQRCAEALLETIPVEVSDQEIEEAYPQMMDRTVAEINASGVTVARWAEEHQVKREDFESQVREDTRQHIALGKALDKAAADENIEVSNHEIPDYLQCSDPDAFIKQLEEEGQLEDARIAAKRVKIMRDVLKNANIQTVEEQ
jgi:FKBP-type peptidyl-prolyl cis-trans isomerase (trigger factor)